VSATSWFAPAIPTGLCLLRAPGAAGLAFR